MNVENRQPGYEKLIAWQKAYELVLKVYEVTKQFPPDERFGLTSQVRRAAVSIPSNIAEGWGRGSTQEYLRFLDIARGSVYEVRTQIAIAADLKYTQRDHAIFELMDEVSRMLAGLIRSLRNKNQSQR